jgi:hypothetical protein
MKKHSGCDFEPLVVKSLKSGFIDNKVSEHIKNCADCGETAKVMRFFQLNAANQSTPKNLPASGLIWWKFKLREKQRRAERVSRPILIAQAAAILIIFGTFVWLKQNDSPYIATLTVSFKRVLSSMEAIAPTFLAGLICFAFICAILIIIMRRFILDK